MPSYTKAATSWTPDRVDLLKELWAKGHSCSQIAAQLGGLTRNAVIGKKSRLGLPERRTTLSATRRKRTVKQPPQKSMAQPVAFRGPEIIPSSKPFSTKVFEAGDRKPVTIDDLHGLSCRFPFDDQDGNHIGYCGATKTGEAYCDFHAAIAYPALRHLAERKEEVA